MTSAVTGATGSLRAAPPKLEIRSLSHRYGDLRVLENLSLSVRTGEFASILGPSGSGKSTTFSILTGAATLESGEILVDGEPLAPERSPFAFMPQQDALLPWRRVMENITLGLEIQGIRRRDARRRVEPLLETFGLDGFESSYPFQLSGGMRQRTSLLRTVVQDRSMLLLDEPFGALDALTRTQMQQWVEGVWERFRWTVLLVTHDVREAIFLSDRVFVFSKRPARVVATVDVPLPRPRELSMLTDSRFVDIERRLLDSLLG
jgi:ABC-type nitrate/sulfonate/bicarbonate transport system ATPase subunit